jgi:hypothetical protein
VYACANILSSDTTTTNNNNNSLLSLTLQLQNGGGGGWTSFKHKILLQETEAPRIRVRGTAVMAAVTPWHTQQHITHY